MSSDTTVQSEISSSGLGKTVFKINEKKYTVAQARVYLTNYQNLYGKMYGVNLLAQTDKWDDFETYIKDMTLTELAQTASMAGLAEEQGMTLSAKQTECVQKAAAQYYDSLNEAERTYFGADEEMLEAMYTDYALANLIYESLTDSVDEEVSDDEARIMQVLQIYVTDESIADTIEKKLKDGGDFSSLAAEYNEADSTELYFGRGDLPQEAEEAAFALENEENSGKIKVDGGWYFIHCINKFDEERTELNKTVIAQERREDAFNLVYEQYVSSINSSVNTKVWDKVGINANEELTTNSFFEVFDQCWN
jgi:foldase protein PrsA